jgi:hypothetical protein
MQVLLCITDEINNEDQRIFRLDERAEARRCRELPRLDPRRLRFFPSCVRAEGYRVRFNTEGSDVSIAILLTLAMRPVGAFLFGRAAPSCADGERPSLLFARICVGLLAPLDRAHRPARAVRNCDGWRLEELLKSQMAVWQTAAQPLVIAAQGAVAGIEQHQLLAAVHNGWNERLDAIGAGAKPATLLGNLLI